MRLFFLFILLSFSLNAQQNSQIWTSMNVLVENKNYFSRIDLGYRFTTTSDFHPSQGLGRFTLLRKLNLIQIGGGFAYFKHQSVESFKNELRPFLQANFLKGFKKHQLNLRFRNEFRFFENERGLDRIRFHIHYRFDLTKRIDLSFSPEFFYTFSTIPISEARYQIGIPTQLFKEQELIIFYQYNWQNKQNETGFHVFGVSYSKRFQLSND